MTHTDSPVTPVLTWKHPAPPDSRERKENLRLRSLVVFTWVVSAFLVPEFSGHLLAKALLAFPKCSRAELRPAPWYHVSLITALGRQRQLEPRV